MVVVSRLKSCSPRPKTEMRAPVPSIFFEISISALLQLTLTLTSTFRALPSPPAGGISTLFLNWPENFDSAGGHAPGLSVLAAPGAAAGGGSLPATQSCSKNFVG